ncbi:hypothetical protein [Saccharopolyspora sp. 6V]|uniref:hypothetical protein n=1 Tax=Saccharopolyspora sp. 6V TaxID=2877239 RepID=UPI001CD614C7|nr:hypothetical protein [Saccharopolyspora sp. 6V]MCA1191675.1 hypothetical protein [Saccharopolyspora sp. 6V]
MSGEYGDNPTQGVGPVREPSLEERQRAVRATASLAKDADDLAGLLDMLGLDPAEGKTAEEEAA